MLNLVSVSTAPTPGYFLVIQLNDAQSGLQLNYLNEEERLPPFQDGTV